MIRQPTVLDAALQCTVHRLGRTVTANKQKSEEAGMKTVQKCINSTRCEETGALEVVLRNLLF